MKFKLDKKTLKKLLSAAFIISFIPVAAPTIASVNLTLTYSVLYIARFVPFIAGLCGLAFLTLRLKYKNPFAFYLVVTTILLGRFISDTHIYEKIFALNTNVIFASFFIYWTFALVSTFISILIAFLLFDNLKKVGAQKLFIIFIAVAGLLYFGSRGLQKVHEIKAEQHWQQLEHQKFAKLPFKYYLPTYVSEGLKGTADAHELYTGWNLSVSYLNAEDHGYTIQESVSPLYYDPPKKCGYNEIYDSHKFDLGCTFIGRSKSGCDVYYRPKEVSDFGNGAFCKIENTLLTLDPRPITTLSQEEALKIFDSLVLADAETVTKLNTQK